MLDSETANYEVKTWVTPVEDGEDICVWLSPKQDDPDNLTTEELESLVHRGTVRELLAEERRQA